MGKHEEALVQLPEGCRCSRGRECDRYVTMVQKTIVVFKVQLFWGENAAWSLGGRERGREGEGELYEELLHTGGESRAVATKASTISGPRVNFEPPTFLPLF